ncbi:bZIP transcription factor 29 [Linum grandiflorum]
MCDTMPQSSPSDSLEETSSNKRIGLPPSHPKNHHISASGLVSDQQQVGLNNGRPSHLRSLSQSSIFSLDSLPPLSPMQHPSMVGDMSVEEKAGASRGLLFPGSRVNEGLPPRRGHRRSMSDNVPLGFGAMIQSSPQLIPIGGQGGFDRLDFVKQEVGWATDVERNVQGMGDRQSMVEVGDDMLNAYIDNIDPLNSSGTEDKDWDSRISGTKTNGTENSDNEAESHIKGLKRNADGEIGPAGRHSRSVSMDSFMGSLQLDDELLKLPPAGNRIGQLSPSSSMQGNFTKFNLEFGNGEFTEAELKKIMSNDKLTELAMADPKRVKRILANRLSAARSKERKMRYISELEQKVHTLQAEATTLSAQVTVLQRDSSNLTSQNHELKFRLQAMEQQAQLKDALNEALVGEVQRLRLAARDVGADTSHQQQQLLGNLMQHQNAYQLQQHQRQQSTQLNQAQSSK